MIHLIQDHLSGYSKAILLCLIILAASPAVAASSFLFDLTITQDGDVTEQNVDLINQEPLIPGEEQGEYTLRLTDADGNTVYTTPTHVSFTKFTFSGTKQMEETQYFVRVPYHADATTMHLEHDGETLTTASITDALCRSNDGTCRPYCAGKGVDPDCGDTGSIPLMLVLLLVVLVAFLVAGIYLYRKKQEEQANEMDLNF